jgi:hypothetical protein
MVRFSSDSGLKSTSQVVRFLPLAKVVDERLGMRLRLFGSPFGIPRHFQTRQQLDIARGAVHGGFTDARGFVSRTGLNP